MSSLNVPIAVIGMSCRLPGGATSPDKLWDMLMEGRSAWSDVPNDRFNWKSFHHPNPEADGAHNHRGGHFLQQDISAFDAAFFGISPLEAQAMDPQQRLLLETSFEAFENAGIPLEAIRGSDTSVYAAMFSRDYDRNIFKDASDIPKYHLTGVGEALVSNRISYVLDLKGPSMTLDTGCSGSMVALHLACQSLRTGESKMAVVGGTNLILSPDHLITMSHLHMLNDDGISYSFDSRGGGYGRGEGVTTVIVKLLEDAIRDGDPIRAVIRNTGVNQDGKTNGITLPSQESQQNLERNIYEAARIDPHDISYVEAHGTGTIAGDIAELRAISNVFTHNSSRKLPLYVGSIKSNIGHLESSSGLAGLIKAILVLEKGLIPPNVNLKAFKRDLRLEAWNIKIPTKVQSWPDDTFRRASVNSFGYGGTNAHAIIEAAAGPYECRYNGYQNGNINGENIDLSNQNGFVHSHDIPPDTKAQGELTFERNTYAIPRLVVLTAKSEKSLQETVEILHTWIQKPQQAGIDIQDLAYTLSCRRSIMPWRHTFAAKTQDDLAKSLASILIRPQKSSTDVRICFLFTGQGAQWFAMGRELIEAQTIFRESMIKSDEILRSLGASWSLMEELSLEKSFSRINKSEIAQPASTALQIALVDMLQTLGVTPSSVVGHSSGEIAAAYAAGALAHDMALKVSFQRSFISSICGRTLTNKGAMLAVGLSEDDVLKHIADINSGTVVVACVNSPSSTTISGDEDAIIELMASLENASVFNRRLNVDTAYHSHHMKKVADEYHNSLADLVAGVPKPSVKFISSVTGLPKESDFGPSYWVENLVSQVKYSQAVQKLCRLQQAESSSMMVPPSYAFIEIGSHSALSGPTSQSIKNLGQATFKHFYAPTLVRNKDAIQTTLEAVGKLFEHGFPIDLKAVVSLSSSPKIPRALFNLPPYAWDHSTSHWYESRLSRDYRLRPYPHHDLLGDRVLASTSLEPSWRNIISLETLPWLKEHVVDNFVVFPGAGYLCMAIEAVKQISQVRNPSDTISRYNLKDVAFLKTLTIPEAPNKLEIQIRLRSLGNTGLSWEQFSVTSLGYDGIWREHCKGFVAVEFFSAAEKSGLKYTDNDKSIVDKLLGNCTEEVDSQQLYRDLEANGNVYGKNFAIIHNFSIGNCEAAGTLTIPDVASTMPAQFMQPHVIHPSTFDAILHPCLPIFSRICGPGAVMPISMEGVSISANLLSDPGTTLVVATTLTQEGRKTAIAETTVIQKHGTFGEEAVLTITQAELRGIGEASSSDSMPLMGRQLGHRLVWDVDVDFFPSNLIEPLDNVKTVNGLSPVKKLDLLNHAASIYMDATIKTLQRIQSPIAKGHYAELLSWMTRYLKSIPEFMVDFEIDRCLDEASRLGVEGEMLCRVGQNLILIMEGKVEPLSLMLDDDLLYRLYADDSSTQCYIHMAEYLQHLSFKNPSMSILEIGAGTGGATLPLLKALSQNEDLKLTSYDFTDISSGFFERARSLLQSWSDIISYKTLDIGNDPITQGFGENTYDLVVAANVLHTTSSIEITLRNVRKLLKPGGRLVLIEVTKLPAYLNVIFGTLPGWWSGVEDGRTDSPLLSRDQWDHSLSRSGFSGLDVAVDDFAGSAQRSTMMVAKAAIVDRPVLPTIGLITANDEGLLGSKIKNILRQNDYEYLSISLPQLLESVDPSIAYVVIDDAESPLMANPNKDQFQSITYLVTHGTQILWISAPSTQASIDNPENGLITGLARTARAENEALRFVTLDIQQNHTECQEDICFKILNILVSSFGEILGVPKTDEFEYTYRDGQLQIPRVVPDSKINSWIEESINEPGVGTSLYHQDGRVLKLEAEKPGLLSSLRFVNGHFSETLCSHEVEIEIKAFGVEEKDVLVALEQTKSGIHMFGECAGIITAVGSDYTNEFSIGDNVCTLGSQQYSGRARFEGAKVHHIPASMSLKTAASVPVSFVTAYYCLTDLANLKRGQTAMIISGADNFGRAALSVAQYLGADIYTTVASLEEKQLLIESLGVPDSHIFLHEVESLKNQVLRSTKQRGVDVIFGTVTPQLSDDLWACVATFGKVIDIEQANPGKDYTTSMKAAFKNVTLIRFDLGTLLAHKRSSIDDTLSSVLSLLDSRSLKQTTRINSMDLSHIEDAFRVVQTKISTDKVILTTDSDTIVKAVNPRREPLKLNNLAAYIVAGGLGDLGQRICKLLVARGAKHLILLSRRLVNSETRQLVEKNLLGTKVEFVTCDIGHLPSLRRSISHLLREESPPIRGVIQATMVLQDRMLEKMSVEDYQAALQPKLHGTRNLSTVLSETPLDFFIMLSSCASIIGNRGQANYAAGNAFQDALANSQMAAHHNFVSLNLGIIEDAGVLALHTESLRSLVRQGYVPVKNSELLSLIEYAMSSQCREDDCHQAIIGFNGESISNSQLTSASSRTSMFSHLARSIKRTSSEQKDNIDNDVKSLLANATSIEEEHRVIITAIARKISAFVAISLEDVNLEWPLINFGLDSLIAIELKNWISRDFQAAMQTSELLDSPSLISLGATVAARSSILLSKKQNGHEPPVEKPDSDTSSMEPPSTNLGNGVQKLELPRLPLPELASTLQLYLGSVAAFCSDDELIHTSKAVQTFQELGGIGEKLHQRLVKRFQDPCIDNWVSELYNASNFLDRRVPLEPFDIFFGSHLMSDVPHTQAQRAAVIAHAAFQFKENLEAGLIAQEYMNEQPLCMESLQWLFNTSREPRTGSDIMRKYPDNDYLMVLRNGHIFKVILKVDEKAVSQAMLEDTFDDILSISENRVPAICTLAADERNSWARIREMVKAQSPDDQKLIETIEAAAFVVCLDDASPTTPIERAYQFLTGSPSNRWSDKSLQYVVCSNGVSAYVAEHSMIDGTTVKQMNDFITDAILTYKPNKIVNGHGDTNGFIHSSIFDEFSFTSTSALEGHINRITQQFHVSTSNVEPAPFVLQSYGGLLMRSNKVPPKTGFQLIIQLASLIHFGYQPASWETISMRPFHKGRVEISQIILPPVLTFTKAALDPKVPAQQLKEFFMEAAKAHANIVTRASRGKGVDRHLSALRQVLQEDEELPDLFKDPIYERTRPRKIMSDCSETRNLEAGFVLRDEENIWCHYEVEDDQCRFSIVGTRGNTKSFTDALEVAAEIVRKMLEAAH